MTPRVQAIVKAAVAAGSLANLEGLVDLQIVAAGFTDSLRSVGVFDGMLASMVRVPLATPGIRVASVGITGYAVGEGQAKPISTFSLGTQALERLKADAIIIVTDEIAKSMTAGAAALVSRELKAAVVAETDGTFLASLATGVTPIASTNDVLSDLITAADQMTVSSSTRLFLVVPAALNWHLRLQPAAATAALAFPSLGETGTIAGIRVLSSDQIPTFGSPDDPSAMLIDAAAIAGDTAGVALDSSTNANIEMSDGPIMSGAVAGSPSGVVEASSVSL